MANFSPPVNPVGSFDPCYMTNAVPGGAGTVDDTHWNTCILGLPAAEGANVLANCVGWCQGRMLQVYLELHPDYDVNPGHIHPFMTLSVNPSAWGTQAENAGLEVVQNPRVGSVLYTNSHVAFVEDYDETTEQWIISESGYGKAENTYKYPQNTLIHVGDHWESTFSYVDEHTPDPLIHGFILVPGAGPGPGPGPQPTGKKKKWIYYMKNWNNAY